MIILILAGLILSISSYVQNKGARARAETEIAAMSAALESYKADNGIYPRDNTATRYTDSLNARSRSCARLPCQSIHQRKLISCTVNSADWMQNQQAVADMKSYFTFKPRCWAIQPAILQL